MWKKKTYLDKHPGKSILNISPHSSPFPTIHTNNPIHGRVWISSITHHLLFQLSKKNMRHTAGDSPKFWVCVLRTHTKTGPNLASKNGCNATFFLGLHDSSGAEALGGCACKSPGGSTTHGSTPTCKGAFGRWKVGRVALRMMELWQKMDISLKETKNLPWSSCEKWGIIIWLVRARRSMGYKNPCKLSFEKQNPQIQDTTLSKKW